jgi:hypothetical protein
VPNSARELTNLLHKEDDYLFRLLIVKPTHGRAFSDMFLQRSQWFVSGRE